MPRSYPDYPHHTQIAAYFEAYVDHFGVRDTIRFETTVAHARRGADGVWDLELADGSVERFDALVVANGHHWDPRWPEPMFPGHETFTGTQIHAHDYRDSDLFAGRRALILGMGNSAMDIAVESSHVAERTFLAARRGAWILPKYLFGRPVDQLPNDPRLPVWLRMRVFETMIRLFVGTPEKYGLPRPTIASARRTRPSRAGSSTACSTARSRRSRTSRASTATRSSSPTDRASASTSSSTAPATGSASRSSTRRSSPPPTTASSCSGASCTPTSRTCSSSRSCSRSARRCRSPSARASGSATSCAASTCRRAGGDAARDPRRGRGHAPPLRGLQAPHDPGRLRRLPARSRGRARGGRRAGAGGRLRAADRAARGGRHGASEDEGLAA